MAADVQHSSLWDERFHAVQQGDREAYALFVVDLHPLVYGIAYSIVREQRVAQQLAQDVMATAWQYRNRPSNRLYFVRWLRKITRILSHHWLEAPTYRRLLRERFCRLLQQSEQMQYPAENVAEDSQEPQNPSGQVLSVLPPCLRESIAVYYLYGQSCKDAAAALEIPETGIRRRVQKARERLFHQVGVGWEQRLDEEWIEYFSEEDAQQFEDCISWGPASPKAAASAAATGIAMRLHAWRHEFHFPPLLVLRMLITWHGIGGLVLLLMLAGAGYIVFFQSNAPSRLSSGLSDISDAPMQSDAVDTPLPEEPPTSSSPGVAQGVGVIQGKVMDEAGMGIAHARIEVYPGTLSHASIFCRMCREYIGEVSVLSSVEADGDGGYTVNTFPVETPLWLVVQADGYGDVYRSVVPGKDEGIDFTLHPAYRITGEVLDAQTRAPISNIEARVTAIYFRAAHFVDIGAFPWKQFNTPTGIFSLSANRYQDVIYTVRAPGYVSFTSERIHLSYDDRPNQIELLRAQTIQGQVFAADTELPLTGVTVGVLTGSLSQEVLERYAWQALGVITDVQGKFVYDRAPLTSEDAVLMAWRVGYAPAFLSLTEAAVSMPVQVFLERPTHIQGTVMQNSAPQEGLRIVAHTVLPGIKGDFHSETKTNSAGMYHIPNMPPGECALTVQNPVNKAIIGWTLLHVEAREIRNQHIELADMGYVEIEGAPFLYQLDGELYVKIRAMQHPDYSIETVSLRGNAGIRMHLEAPATYEACLFSSALPEQPLYTFPFEIAPGEDLHVLLDPPANIFEVN